MTKYYFHIRDRHGLVSDDEGENFRFFGEALKEAEDSARDLAKQLLRDDTVLLEQCVEVSDEKGRVLAALPVVEVLRHPNFPKFKKEC